MGEGLNLFDFSSALPDYKSSLNPFKSSVKPKPASPAGVIGGGVNPPTVTGETVPSYKTSRYSAPVVENVGSAEVSKKSNKDVIQAFLSNTSIPRSERKKIFDLIGKGEDENSIIRLISSSAVVNEQTPANVTSLNKSETKPEVVDGGGELSGFEKFMEDFNKSVGGEVEGVKRAIATPLVESPRIVSNIAGAVLDVGGGKYWGKEDKGVLETSSDLKKWGEGVTAKGEEAIGLEGANKDASRLVTDIASTIAMPGGVVGSAKMLQGVNVGGKVSSGLARAGTIGASGVLDAAKYSTVSRGDLAPTGEEAVLSAGLGVAGNLSKSIPGIRKLVGKSEILNVGDDLVIDGEKIIGTAKEVTDKINNAAIRLANVNSAGKNKEQVIKEANKIVGGVMGIDGKSVKSSDDLFSSLKQKEAELMRLKRLHNQKSDVRLGAENFIDEIDVGGVKTRVNPVDEAFDSLSDNGAVSKFNNEERATINYLREAYANKGLTKDELDVLAGFYGRANDAFKKNQLQTSKVFGESTRNALKDKVRTLWGEDGVASTLDDVYSSVRMVREGLGELLGKAEVQGAKTASKPLEKAGEFIGNVTQSSTQGFVRGLFRSLFGGGKIGDTVLSTKELADEALKNFQTIRKYKELLDGAKTEKAKTAIIDSAKREFSKNGVIPSPYAIGEKAKLEDKLFPKNAPLLPSASGKKEFVSKPTIQVPKGGFNSPEITPKSIIRKPSTPVKPKPYKEPNYKTPLPRKKNIPKPKPMKI